MAALSRRHVRQYFEMESGGILQDSRGTRERVQLEIEERGAQGCVHLHYLPQLGRQAPAALDRRNSG
jgi:hypothetical protein